MAETVDPAEATSPPAADSTAAPATTTTAPATPPTTAPAAENATIEVDQDTVDDPTFDEQLSTFTASLRSSVIDYPVEHGRRYHAFRNGSYVFPNDERELERLDVFHHLMVRSIGGVLHLAPIKEDEVQKILDIGTGTGTWAIEMGDLFPGAEVLGCDLSPVQPTWVPPNVKFEVDDVESDWTYNTPFDYIMCRYMAGSIGDWPKLFKNIYNNIKPGCWAEFQDWDLRYLSDDGSLTEEHYTKKWNITFLGTLAGINRNACPGPNLRQYAEDAGFINIHEEVFKVPIGPWAKDSELKQIGMINLVQLLDGLEAFSIKVFLMAGYTEQEITVLLAEVRKELKSREFHSYITFYIVYGQKPGEHEGGESAA